MVRGRSGSGMIVCGAAGLFVGRILAANGNTDPVWTKDTDFQTALVLALTVLAIAVWNFRRFGFGKLVAISFLAFGGLLEALARIDRDDPPGPGGGAGEGVEWIGLYLMVISAAATFIGVVWSSTTERMEAETS